MRKLIKIKTHRPWIAYAGSVIQQNYAEALTHGFLLWEIENRDKFDVRFCELPNPKPFSTIEWQGSVDDTLEEARKHPLGSRFRVKNNDALTQKDVANLTAALRKELHASEVTFKSDKQVNRSVISTGVTTLAKDDLRNPDVLLRLLREYHQENNITNDEWQAVRNQVEIYLQQTLESDDLIRDIKWSIRNLKFDNMFTYGQCNEINFEQLNGLVGVFGPNRAGKSSIVGTILYSLFNMTDRGSVKNLHVINTRQPYCYTKAIVNVAGTNYVLERQTTKHESKKGQINAGTALNLLKIDESGDEIDLSGEQRLDTEKTIKKLLGNPDDCLLTSISTQDDIKLFINQGTSKRRKDLTRFLDLDIFDRMHDLAKNDVNVNKSALKNLPERDWDALRKSFDKEQTECCDSIREKDVTLHGVNQKLHELRVQLTSFKNFTPVTKSQVESQVMSVNLFEKKLFDANVKLSDLKEDIDKLTKKILSIETVRSNYDLHELRRRLDAYRTLESSFENLKVIHQSDDSQLKQYERSLKILDEVPCGDSFPSCKFIKDAFKNKEKIDSQNEKVQKALEKLQKAELSLAELRKENIVDKISKIEQLNELLSKLKVTISSREVELMKLESTIIDLNSSLESSKQKLFELNEALKNEENVEVVSIRNSIEELQRTAKKLDAEKLSLASEAGRLRSDYDKVDRQRKQRLEFLQLMKVHELIAQAFSRRGIPNLIVASQLPVINAEIAKILNGIVNFTVELEQDVDSDSMEIYIDYGDSKRIIELGSGMEKMIASIAIRVALINVSSLPKTDMFIIDEGFGSLDPASVEACNRLLVSLKRYFRIIMVISHVDGIKDVADYVIEIEKREKDAYVYVK